MQELTRTNDPVLLSWLLQALAHVSIEAIVFDVHTSILEGSISAIPRRIMVREVDMVRARRVLDEAEAIAAGDIEEVSE
ncbi:MAG TPA: DUF2007 domain-containing protein [Rhodospirillales bacterium]|nr:DUF2007 domain-containing protein [Rhodospirillales bacterium]